MFEEMKIPYTYTIEASNGFYYNPTTLVTYEFNRSRWHEMGVKIG
jgi:hypothetical protein